jgi:threonine/homoserine/homoserine lactone efflux protein
MSWSKYAEFLVFAVVLVLIPGPDFAVVTRNTLVGGQRRGSCPSSSPRTRASAGC